MSKTKKETNFEIITSGTQQVYNIEKQQVAKGEVYNDVEKMLGKMKIQ